MAKEKDTTTFRCRECGKNYEWKAGMCGHRCPACVKKADDAIAKRKEG